MSLNEQLARWEAELVRLHSPSRWGEARRFAGQSACLRLEKIDRLIARIAKAKAGGLK